MHLGPPIRDFFPLALSTSSRIAFSGSLVVIYSLLLYFILIFDGYSLLVWKLFSLSIFKIAFHRLLAPIVATDKLATLHLFLRRKCITWNLACFYDFYFVFSVLYCPYDIISVDFFLFGFCWLSWNWIYVFHHFCKILKSLSF